MFGAPIALFATANWVHIPFEEAKMRRQFGAAYDNYVARGAALDMNGRISRSISLIDTKQTPALKACRRELIDPKIAEHRGRMVKTTGDGALFEFASAVRDRSNGGRR